MSLVNYDWAVGHYSKDFVDDILDPQTGFGFVAAVDVGAEGRIKGLLIE